MAKENHPYKIISVVLLVAVIAFAGLYFIKSAPSQEINEQTCSDFINDCPKNEFENVGILDAQVFDWKINENNLSEMFFDYWIYNYGDSESKNVVVRCDLWNEAGIQIVSTARDTYGNLASRSADFGEIITKDVSKAGVYYIPLCYVESCDNCENLYKRIPDLVESYEE